MMNDQDIRKRAKSIIAEAVNAVLTTVDSAGYPHSRTMWTAGIDDDFTTYCVTGRGMEKVKQIRANPRVSCFWTKTDEGAIGWDYVMLKGEAKATDEQELRDRFWDDTLKEYFPHGKDDPAFMIVVVEPKEMLVMDSRKYPLDKVEF